LLTHRNKWLESRQPGFAFVLGSLPSKLYFFQSGQENKVITTTLFVSLKEGARNVVVICAFGLEHLDTGELLIEPKPCDIIHPVLGVILHFPKGDTKFLHGSESCRERAAHTKYRL
jgi:hypothetical protein